LQALDASEAAEASQRLQERLQGGVDPWEIHLSLFPAVQRVLNPPFINPHLPKMYRILRELAPHLEKQDIASLLRLEVAEYARRPKLARLSRTRPFASSASFRDIEAAIGEQDWKKTADSMAAFHAREGGAELARQLLLLGSGYLEHSLGHSVSCTAFILLEMMQRKDQDPWPVLVTLADYFCKGQFCIRPTLLKSTEPVSEETLRQSLLKATSGRGIVNLHHTITLYAIERVRQLFTIDEYQHMIGAWNEFVGSKETEPLEPGGARVEKVTAYPQFRETFTRLEPEPVVASALEMMASPEGRKQLFRFLIKGVCDLYQGDYNPHYLTGLGSVLWALDQYGAETGIPDAALFQYLSFFFEGLKENN
jgi:hypothetical protein